MGTYVPSWSAVVCLGGIVPAIPVAAEEKYFVLHVIGRVVVKLLDLVVEPLPLCQSLVVLQLFICWVSEVEEAEVDGRL